MRKPVLYCVDVPPGVRVAGLDADRRIELEPGRALRIGVSEQCDVIISGVDIGGRINCIVVADEQGACRLSHAGHPRPILINGRKLMPLSTSRLLADGDVIEPVCHDRATPRFVFRLEEAAARRADPPTPPPRTPPRADPTWRPPKGFQVESGRAAGRTYAQISYDGAPWADVEIGPDDHMIISLHPSAEQRSFAFEDLERILASARAQLLAFRSGTFERAK